MTGSRILLLVGILAGGTAVEASYQVREHLGVGPFGWRLFGGKFYGPHHLFEQRAERELPADAPVSIRNAFGDVDVKAGEPGKVVVLLRKDVYVGDAAKAKAFADRIELRLDVVDGRLSVGTNREELEREHDAFDIGFETHLDVQVPPGTALALEGAHGRASVEDAGELKLDNAYGDVSARRVGAAQLDVKHGNASIEEARAAASLDVRYGDASVKGVPGAVSVTSEHGSVTTERTGPLTVDLKYGDLKADTVAGNLHVRGEHAGVEARHVGGAADVESSFADTKLEDLDADAVVKVEHGAVRIARAKGAVVARSSYDDVELDDVAGRVEAEASHGGVRARRVAGGGELRTDGDDVLLEGFRGAVVAEATRGSVRLVPDGPVASGVRASASFGNVRLQVPEGSGFELEAEASGGGDLRVALPGLTTKEQSDGRLVGRLGAGGPRVELRAEHGDVRVTTRGAGRNDADDE